MTFIPNPENKPQVNHINGIKDCNWVGNLEWVTNQENIQHAYKMGLIKVPKGENSRFSIYSEKQIKNIIDLIMKGYSNKEISDKLNIKKRTVKAVKSKTEWKHLTKGITFPKYNNTHKRYEEFKDIPAGYIYELINNGNTNNQIYEITNLFKSKSTHKVLNKIRKERIATLKRRIREIKKKDEKDKDDKIKIKYFKEWLKIIKESQFKSDDDFINENYDIYHLKEILNDPNIEEVLLFKSEL